MCAVCALLLSLGSFIPSVQSSAVAGPQQSGVHFNNECGGDICTQTDILHNVRVRRFGVSRVCLGFLGERPTALGLKGARLGRADPPKGGGRFQRRVWRAGVSKSARSVRAPLVPKGCLFIMLAEAEE